MSKSIDDFSDLLIEHRSKPVNPILAAVLWRPIKRILISGFCRDLIPAELVIFFFKHFPLSGV